MTDTPKPAPATPAATPMAQPQRALSELEVCIRARAYKHEDRELLQLCNQMRALLRPAAAQPQRESEQPEQALREADRIVSCWLANEAWISTGNCPQLEDEAIYLLKQRIAAALSPQTDSQEPR